MDMMHQKHNLAAHMPVPACPRAGLGYMYLSGQGVAPNADKAFKYFTAAAEQGNADAHFYLGSMHLNGQGVRRKSAARAFHYFYLAANAGHAQVGGLGDTALSCSRVINQWQ